VITVVGAGGIGGPLAGFLKLAGERVQVVEVGPHLEAIRTRGLCLQGVRGEHHITFDDVCAPDELRGPLDLVFVATRANRTDAAVDAILPHLASDGLVVSTQNGLNALTIAPRIGEARTIPCMVHMVGAVTEPGVVCRFTEGEFYVGEFSGAVSQRVVDLAGRMSVAVRTTAVDNVWGYIWCKLIHVAQNCGVALVDLPAGEVRADDWVRRILVALELEVVDAARAHGVQLEAYERIDPRVLTELRTRDDLERALEMLPHASEKGFNGLQRELHRGERTEIDAVCGVIRDVGQRHGLPMSLTSRLIELIHDLEERRRTQGFDLLRELQPAAEQLLADRTRAAA
jgi:2-dehydropantoate 2-reductase